MRTLLQLGGLTIVWLATRGSDVNPWVLVAVVLGVVTLPRLLADAWHEFVHEPRFGVAPVSPVAFVVTSIGRLVLEGVLLGGAWMVLERSFGVRGVVAVGCAAASIPLASALFGSRVVLALHRVVDVPVHHAAHDQVASLAAQHGLERPRLVELDQATFEGANAYVTGQRSNLTIAVSHQLLNGPEALLRHVVSHEMAHLRRRHLLWSALASALAVGLATASSVALVVREGEGAGRLPLLVLSLFVISGPFRLVLAWQSRAHERQADRAAMRDAPIPTSLVRALHMSDRPLLEPSRLARWQNTHPSPAERLEAADRTLSSSLA